VKEIEKISSFQFFILVVMFVLGSAVLFLPTVIAAAAKEDAWIVAIIGGILGLGIALLYVKLAASYQGDNLTQMYESAFGIVIGKLLTIIFCYYCLVLASLILRGIGDFMVSQIMPETPIEVIMGMFIVFIIIAQKYGIEVFARSAEIFFPWVIFLLVLAVSIIFRDIKVSEIFPILDKGIKPILKGTFSYLGFPYLECVLLLMVVPYLNQFKKVKKTWLLGTFAGSIILFIAVILSITVLGPEITSRQSYVMYVLAKKIGIRDVFERMEVIFAIFWILTIFYKLLLCIFCLTRAVGSLFKLTNEDFLIFPLGVYIYCTAIISGENVVYLNDFSSEIWPFFALQTGLILPLILLLIGKFHKNQSEKSNT
jgi:spore germination protein KB